MLPLRIYFLLFLFQVTAFAQCPVADFNTPAIACRNQYLEMQNLTTGASQYEWDFCGGDFSATPQANIVLSSTLLFRTRSIRIISEQNSWFGFTIDQRSSPNRLIRFEFGASLSNTPTIHDMGNPSSALSGAYDFRMHKQDGTWYALVANTEGNNILRMTFSSGLQAAPVVQNLGTFSTPNSIFLISYNGSLLAFVGSVSEITRLNFGNSVLNTPSAASFPVTGGNNLRGIAITRECDKWFGLVTSHANAKIFWLNFNNDLLATPLMGELAIPVSPAYNFPASIVINEDGGEYFAFIQSAVGPLYRLSFGQSIIDRTGTGTNLGNLGISNENFAQDWVRDGSTWFGFSIDLANRRLARITLPVTCGAETPTSTEANPAIRYTTSGTYNITLRAVNAAQAVHAVRKPITITANASPDINFTTQNVCANHDVNFNAVNTSGDIATYDWNFGDAGSSSDHNPTHQYAAAGEYAVDLRVTAVNGCENSSAGPIKIYDPPVAGFVAPAGQLCTNTPITFTNDTDDEFDGHLTYQWYLDGNPVSTDRDFVRTFINTGLKTIRLETTIPGCGDEITKATSNIQAGPIVDFSSAGVCDGDNIRFTSDIPETVTSYDWNFDDGASSSQQHPAHTFPGAGTYMVSLTALSSSGCNNTKTKEVIIRSRPSVDFAVDPPPQSCSNLPTPFINLTPDPADSDIVSWQWDFGDPGTGNMSDAKAPAHTFINAGTYDVTLAATTDYGCLRSVQKTVTIAQSPAAAIGHSLVCSSIPVNFTSAATNTETYYWEMGTSYYEVANPVHTFNTSGDQVVKLRVKSANLCEVVYHKTVSVPAVLSPDFSVAKNCIGTDAVFTDITTGSDAIAQQAWDFGGLGTATASPASFSFSTGGSKTIKLTVTGQSGCSYTASKTVNIVPAPVAAFTTSPETGASPLSVQFTNTSTGATQYLWTFGDGTTSVEVSPAYVFQQTGEFTSSLKATNNEGCASTLSKVIRAVAPLPDVDLKIITISENADGSLKVIITLQNNGNTILRDLPVSVDISGSVSLRETVPGPIAPSSLYNLALSYGLSRANVDFLCATAELQNDLAPEGNRICTELNNKTSFIAPYPNPAKNMLNIEWVAQGKQTVSIRLVDAFGKKILDNRILSSDGLNHYRFDTSELEGGIYLLILDDGTTIRTEKVLISAEN